MTVQNAWTELVAKNPMLIEVSRFRRKLFSFSSSNPVGGLIVAVSAIAYVGIVSMIVTFRSEIDPFVLVGVQTVLFAILAPILLHSSIAGERERRSWDLLLVAPITKAQIVVGKFLGALSAMAIGAAFFVFPIAVTAFSYKTDLIVDPGIGAMTFHRAMSLWNLGLAEATCLSFTALVCALTLFFSARVKRPFMALGNTLGLMVVGLFVTPAIFDTRPSAGLDPLLLMHPAFVLERLATAPSSDATSRIIPDSMCGFPQILFYLGLTAVMIGWTVNTLNFAENEVKFLPKAKTRC